MNPETLKRAGRFGAYCGRHLLALGVTLLAAAAAWTAVYALLFLWAVVMNQGLGGPLAYPFGLLFVVAFMGAVGLVLLFPSTALAEQVARRHGFPILAQIPISVGILALLCLGAAGIVLVTASQPKLAETSGGVGLLFLALLLPLGLYWWTAQSVPLLTSLLARIRHVRQARPA